MKKKETDFFFAIKVRGNEALVKGGAHPLHRSLKSLRLVVLYFFFLYFSFLFIHIVNLRSYHNSLSAPAIEFVWFQNFFSFSFTILSLSKATSCLPNVVLVFRFIIGWVLLKKPENFFSLVYIIFSWKEKLRNAFPIPSDSSHKIVKVASSCLPSGSIRWESIWP